MNARFPLLSPDEQKANPDLPVDPWDESDFAVKIARNTFHQVIRRHQEQGEVGEVHKLATEYARMMAMVWICETIEPVRVQFNAVLDRLGLNADLDNGEGSPPAGK
jgi:hypothetical protein